MIKKNEIKAYVPDEHLVNRLLIKLDPEFFTLSHEEQEQKRQHFLYNRMDEICTFLYKELFDVNYNPDWDRHDDPLTNEQLHLLNAHTTMLCGIGENYFKLNELKDDSFDLTSFSNLFEFDKEEFDYQQSHWKKDVDSYEEKPYRLYLNHCWTRFLDQDKHFFYSTLSSLSYYILDELQQADDEVIQSVLPYDWEEGKDNEKEVDGGFQWDYQRNANGREAELEELLERIRNYQNQRYQELNEGFDMSEDAAVYLITKQSDYDGPSINVIVNNAKAARKITFNHFLKDCKALENPVSDLEALVEREVQKQKSFIKKAYQDICDNFDPTIVKFKKKNKVIFSSGALSDLAGISERSVTDEEPKE